MLKFKRKFAPLIVGVMTVSLAACSPGKTSDQISEGTFGGGGPGFVAALNVEVPNLTLTFWRQDSVDGPVSETAYSLERTEGDTYAISQHGLSCGKATVKESNGDLITVVYGTVSLRLSHIDKSLVSVGVRRLKDSQQYLNLTKKSAGKWVYGPVEPTCARS
jgi:hypothetical protein